MDREIRILLDERAINAVMQRYCHAMDNGLEKEWVDCFTQDAVFDVRMPDGELVHREEGAKDLARYVANYPKPPDTRRHVYTTSVFDVDPEAGEARVQSYFLLFSRGPDDTAVLGAFGTSNDRWVRLKDGWRIKERISVAEARNIFPPTK